jgi:hypothetical protein
VFQEATHVAIDETWGSIDESLEHGLLLLVLVAHGPVWRCSTDCKRYCVEKADMERGLEHREATDRGGGNKDSGRIVDETPSRLFLLQECMN